MRKFTIEDAGDAFEMNKHQEVRRYIVGEPEPTLDSIKQLIQNNTLADYEKYGYGRLAVIHKETGKFIGFTGLKYEEELDEVDLGYRLHPAFWGKGLATEAASPTVHYGFHKLNLERIVAGAIPENKGSIRIMEKLGMKFEKMIMIDGHEMVLYVLSREDFMGQTD